MTAQVRLILAAGLVAGSLCIQGCKSIGGITGAVAGVGSTAASGNPAVGIAVGIGVKAGVDEAVKSLLRFWTREEQEQIASIVGELPVGQRRQWQVRHVLPYAERSGDVTVVRAFETPLASCKEALFSVDTPPSDDLTAQASANPSRFITTVCQGAVGWRWAAAEPAVGRWGVLQ